jgi:hypothetical protein
MGLHKGMTNNPNGRPLGSLNKKTLEWEEFGSMFVAEALPKVAEFINDCMDSNDEDLKFKASGLALDVLEYFKPKQARVTHAGDEKAPVIIQVHPDL